METKTIGKLISALRRAKGMTQKELGELLHVSDKTVSRWERDECAPELSLIPVIAEIFEITTDELLRGERRASDAVLSQSQKGKAEKQYKHLLHSRRVRFRNLSMVSAGILGGAVLLACFADTAVLSNVLLLAGTVCQLCFASSALLPVEEEEEYLPEKRSFNAWVTRTTVRVVEGMVLAAAFLLPMSLFPLAGLTGVGLDACLIYGAGAAGLMMVVLHLLYLFWVEKKLIQKGLLLQTQSQAQFREWQRKLLKKTAAIACGIILLLLCCQTALQAMGAEVFSKPLVFYSFESFQEHMRSVWLQQRREEQDLVWSVDGPIVTGDEELVYEQELHKETLEGEDGTVYCEYLVPWNYISRLSWSVDQQTGDATIFLYTRADMEGGYRQLQGWTQVLTGCMALTVLGWALVYGIRVKKQRA